MGQPLFVLGKQRSGTTWLSNQLSQHSQIAAVRHDHHGGIHESAYFSHVAGRYGDLSRQTNYVEFVEVMAASDTLRILEIDKAFLYSLWPTTYEGVFRAVMDRAAYKKRSRYWLDKTPEHTLLADQLAATYPDAKFIAITRNPYDVMRSNMGRYSGAKRQRRTALFRGTLNLVHHNKEIARFARRCERTKVVQFEDMRRQPERVFRDLINFLELDFEPSALEEAYVPNTTFQAERRQQRDNVLSEGDKRLIKLALAVGGYIPADGFRVARRLTDQGVKTPLPRWFFSMYAPVFEEQREGREAKQAALQGRNKHLVK